MFDVNDFAVARGAARASRALEFVDLARKVVGVGSVGTQAWVVLLARAHARSGDSVAICGYLGKSDRFDRALVSFAAAYADQNERDHRAFVDAIDAGKLPAEHGV